MVGINIEKQKILTAGELRNLVHYEPETGVFRRLVGPCTNPGLAGKVVGSVDSKGYVVIPLRNQRFKAHRMAWLYMTSEWPPQLIDHINGEKGDNRWINLRLATKAQNEQNKAESIANTSGRKGVYFNKAAGKWQAFIKTKGQVRYLGIYENKGDAVAARARAEIEMFGEFARAA